MRPLIRRRFTFILLLGYLVAVCSVYLVLPPESSADQVPRKLPQHAGAKRSMPPTSKLAGAPKPVAAHSQNEAASLRELSVYPSSVSLTGAKAGQRLVVEGTFEDGHQEDLTAQVTLATSNSKVAEIEGPLVRPSGDGKAVIRASFGGHEATAQVEVKDFSAPFVWSFRNHVLPVMTKMSCNSGACHGAAAGKNGFKLTLRGYDPEADYATLTRQALGRRTVRVEPARSLILLKPTLTIPHGGGRRFPVGSPEYQVISGWIAAGMPPPLDSDSRVQSIEVLPQEVSLRKGDEQQLLVRAHFSDGHVEDATQWAKYTSVDDSVGAVDEFGHVKMRGYGEGPVTVWYLNLVSFARLRVPFPVQVDEEVFRRAPRNNYVDDLVLKKLQQLHIPPSLPATDAEFIRRAYLDVAGMLPRPAETAEFLADSAPAKRARLIDQLLTRSEFVDYWAYKWSDLLLVSSEKLAPDAMWSYYNWIRDSVRANKPWDQFVREIISATGNTTENGAANYYAIHRDPIDITENVSQAFLGLSIKCAHCHNHPMEKWTQNDYFSMANLFSRVRLKTGEFSRSRRALEDVTVFTSPTGEISHPRLGRPMPPRPLDGQPLPFDSPADRRVYFAQWLTSPSNPYFARSIVNRIWRNFMGRGLVDPVDDMRATNPASNEELLNALVQDFVGHGFDVRRLIATIMNSATYQTSSRPNEHNVQDEKYHSHYLLRRLPAEVLLDAFSEVTQVPEKFEGYPVGMRALQLPDTQVESYFLTAFGRPPRQETRESERQSAPTITQALHVINGETLNRKLRAPAGTVDMLLKLGLPDDQVVAYLYLTAFSRYPTDAERRGILDQLPQKEPGQSDSWDNSSSRRAALEDLMWAMLTGEEFMFNH